MGIIKTDLRYLHGEDLQRAGRWIDVTLTIKSLGAEDSALTFDKKPIPGFPMTFTDSQKVLVIKQKSANLRLTLALLGNDPDKWVGKKITFYPATSGDFKWWGKPDTLAVRVRIPDGTPSPSIAPRLLGEDLTKHGEHNPTTK